MVCNTVEVLRGPKGDKGDKGDQGVPGNALVLLGKLIGANMNTIADQLISISGGNTYLIKDPVITNSSVDLSTGGIQKGYFYPQVSRGGVEIAIASTASLQSLLNSTWIISGNNNGMTILQNQIVTGNAIYFSLNAGHGSVATADIYIYGYILN